MVSEMETKALKEIANHYGIRQVLENTTMLYNAIGDMLGEDGNKLRNQMRLAMDAGVGNLYLQQIQVPAVGFEHRVMTVLQEDCGMSSDSASNLKRLLDEMTGMIPAAILYGSESTRLHKRCGERKGELSDGFLSTLCFYGYRSTTC